jgi:hypothetical protein
MVTAWLVGLGLGLVLAIPPGPIAIAILRQALAGQARAGVAMALGAAAMDSVSACIAGWASSALVVSLQSTIRDHTWGLLAVQGGGIVVLVGCGLRYLRTPARGRCPGPPGSPGPHPQRRLPHAAGGAARARRADQSHLPPHLTLSHERRAGPGLGGHRCGGARRVCPRLWHRQRALVHLAPQGIDAAASATLPPGPAQAVARGGRGHAPVRRDPNVSPGDGNPLDAPSRMVVAACRVVRASSCRHGLGPSAAVPTGVARGVRWGHRLLAGGRPHAPSSQMRCWGPMGGVRRGRRRVAWFMPALPTAAPSPGAAVGHTTNGCTRAAERGAWALGGAPMPGGGALRARVRTSSGASNPVRGGVSRR